MVTRGAAALTYGGPVKWLRQDAMASGKRSAPFPFGLTVLGAAHLTGQGGGLDKDSNPHDHPPPIRRVVAWVV